MTRLLFGLVYATGTVATVTGVIDGAYILKLSPESSIGSGVHSRSLDQHDLFHKRAIGIDYSVRHEFKDPEAYLGLSIHLEGAHTIDEAYILLRSIAGVEEVTAVAEVHLPAPPEIGNNTESPAHPFLSYSKMATPFGSPSGTDDLNSALKMAGVDKLHHQDVKGKGVRVGIIDAGVDYRHPALGGGFGPGYKIAGGYSWITDNGTALKSPDPLSTCYGGAHGTHVSGIIGMNALQPPEGLPVAGVAPEASLYMYRVFDCQTRGGGSDVIMAAMLKAKEDGMHVVSLSLGLGKPPLTGLGDPLADVIKKLTDAGIGVVTAMANNAAGGTRMTDIYTEEWPSTEPDAVGVGAVVNTNFPITYGATASKGGSFQYASIWPIAGMLADVYMLDDGCSRSSWDAALRKVNAAGKLNTTVFAYNVTDFCRPVDSTICCSSRQAPKYVMGLWSNMTFIYNTLYNLPSQARLGTAQAISVDATDASQLLAGWASTSGFGEFTITFPDVSTYSSPVQETGGLMDYYSSFGPERLTYKLKPQISAPGGNILSTWPLGELGGYGVMSGTSMATPYIAGCYALVKSRFPNASPAEIAAMLQTTADPMAWIYNASMLSATQQQGAGLVNVYKAITAESTVAPGQLLISDVSHTVYGVANITLANRSQQAKTYTFSHQGAGYMDQYLMLNEVNQLARFGSASFSPASVSVDPGQSAVVQVTVTPPPGVDPGQLPVFGGYIRVHDGDEDGDDFSVPYSGPPYSLYNSAYIFRFSSADVTLPEIWFKRWDDSEITVVDLIEVNNTMSWGSSATFDLWTTEYRVDVVPANTTVPVLSWGFNRSAPYEYRPAADPPTSSFLGYPTYGNLKDITGLSSPANNYSPFGGPGFTVKGDDGHNHVLGPGDYRWLMSVLRWDGDRTNFSDFDTWLGPVIRIVDGQVSS